MANRATHVASGAVTATAVWLMHCRKSGRRIDLGELAVVGIGGAFCGALADIAEPAVHPRHRGFFHSWTAAGLLVFCTWKICTDPGCSNDLKGLVKTLSTAHGSHLLSDCLTELGLPVV